MRRLLLLLMAFLIAAPAFARMGLRDGRGDYVPQVVLTYPTKETADLTGKASLKFEWSSHESASGMREYYDFRLYKGYDMLEGALVMKERIDPNTCTIEVKQDLLADGQVYTWSVRQMFDGGRKSDRSYASFKAIKR